MRLAIRLRTHYELLAEKLFQQYEPIKKEARLTSRGFLSKLNIWLCNFDTEEQQWAAFRSVEYLFFAGQDEFEELYRCALQHKIVPWLIDQAQIDIFGIDAETQIDSELCACWPCPVTDSLRISAFLHISRMSGKPYRPDWASLKQFSCKEKIEEYKKTENIKYLVLLEDFVGSGGQVVRVLKFAFEVFTGPIFLVPLIICAPGDRKIRELISSSRRKDISYNPVLVIEDSCLISEIPQSSEPKLFAELRGAMDAGYKKIAKNEELNGKGYGWEATGSLMVMHSNCPNNTPPIYHYSSSNWQPLFPRAIREPQRKKS